MIVLLPMDDDDNNKMVFCSQTRDCYTIFLSFYSFLRSFVLCSMLKALSNND